MSQKKKRRKEVTLLAWIEEEKASGEDLIPEGSAPFVYAERVGLPVDLLALAWWKFKDRYSSGADASKTYADWRAVFLKAIKDDWLKLWRRSPSGEWILTTAGQQAQIERDAA